MTSRRYPRAVKITSARKIISAAVGTGVVVGLLVAMSGPALAIHDGTRSRTERHPWVVAIEDRSGSQFCGGTVVRERFVLTAAHCVVRRTPGSLRVVVGRTDLRTDEGRVVRVDEIWI